MGLLALVALAFLASAGVTFLILGCALPQYNDWWLMFVLVFYFICPIPYLIYRRFSESVESSGALLEIAIFTTVCIVVSAFGLPIVLAHKDVVKWGATGLVLAGNFIVFKTILLFFIFFTREESYEYSNW